MQNVPAPAHGLTSPSGESTVAKAKPKSNAAAFLSLEAEHAELCRDKHQITEAGAAKAKAQIAKVEEQIKNICDLANSDEEPGFGECFLQMFRKSERSSQAFIDYHRERDRLLMLLGKLTADKHRHTLA